MSTATEEEALLDQLVNAAIRVDARSIADTAHALLKTQAQLLEERYLYSIVTKPTNTSFSKAIEVDAQRKKELQKITEDLSDLIPVLIAAAKEVAQNPNDQKAKQKLSELKVSSKLDMLQCNWFLK